MPSLARTTIAVVALAHLMSFDPVFASTPFGYSANAGWLHFAPTPSTQVVATPRVLSGHAYAANFGWIDFGDGTPADGIAYTNSATDDFGVNHDGDGELSGFAYAGNIGWINFAWATADDPNRPRVDLVTGAAAGYAYSPNVGWINLADLVMPGVQAHVVFSNENPTSGAPLTLSLVVAGTETLGVEWLLNGVPIAGATGFSYALPSVQRFHTGGYSVRLTREDGGIHDVAAVELSAAIPAPNDARLLNLSTRGLAQGGDNVLIPGFVIDGTATKRLLIRTVGPTLGEHPFNLVGTVPDPIMQLKRYNSGTSSYEDLFGNDDWQTNTNASDIAATAAQLFAFALQDPKDAALLVDLPAGQYSVIARDKTDTSGIAIVELYDADGDTPDSRLINISNRGFCGVGDQVMIPGFVVSSEGPKTLLVRVVGPTLGSFNVPGTMTDPKLEVYPGGGSTPVLANDDWGDNPDAAYTVQIAEQVSAFPLTAGSKDAAFVVTLQPGSYTVVGSSAVAGGTGVVLVEVYVVP